MDLKSFGEEEFDPKQWINKAWKSSGNQEKEVFVANAVTRLQLYMKQLTNSLDETTTQILSSIPRVLQDASALQLEGALLQQQLLSLEQKVQGVEEQTGHSIERLQRIDQLKSKLENAASTLREADKWAALVAWLQDTLEAGVPTHPDKLNELASQLHAMTNSLEVLSDAPDYESKRLQLETLYNRLEAAVSPPLIEALTQMSAERTATYVSVFAGMGRGLSASRCWRRAAAARLAHAWRRTDLYCLRALNALLASETHTQVEWLGNVLQCESPVDELVRLYTDLLLSLEPAPTKVVSANLKLCGTPEEGIAMIVDVRRDVDETVNIVRAAVDASTEQPGARTLREFGLAAYAPLRELLPQYMELQKQQFHKHLLQPTLQQTDLVEQSRALLTLAERCSGWLQTAHNCARSIAGDAVYPYYLPAVESFISSISALISTHSRHIETTFLSATADHHPGVLSDAFPASLVLESVVCVVLDAVQDMQNVEDRDPTAESPLLDLPLLLLDSATRQRLPSIRADTLPSIAGLRRTKDQLRGLAKAIVRKPVDAQLDKIPSLSVWSNNDALSTDLPDFALSPQEYITEIGQYLMTLPQHLEMHVSEKQAPLQFLSDVCTHTCDMLAEKIFTVRNMDALGTKRCLTDIVYLSSVVEDLGSSITPSLKNLEKSLRATAHITAE